MARLRCGQHERAIGHERRRPQGLWGPRRVAKSGKRGEKITFLASGGAIRLLLRPAAPIITKRLLITKDYEVIFYARVGGVLSQIARSLCLHHEEEKDHCVLSTKEGVHRYHCRSTLQRLHEGGRKKDKRVRVNASFLGVLVASVVLPEPRL